MFIVVSALTGGAVLRVTGRVFLGWGPTEGPNRMQQRAAKEDEEEIGEPRDRTPPMMVAVPAVLIALALAVGLIPGAVPEIEHATALFTDHGAYTRWVLHDRNVAWPVVPASHVSADDVLYGVLAVLGALAAAAIGLFGRALREAIPRALSRPGLAAVNGLRGLHSGHIGDYIAWWTAGVGLLGGACLVALR